MSLPALSEFFEATEKKAELTIDRSLPSFRSRGEEYWRKITGAAGARILSRMSNASCDAYLLSESSLFVFDHKLLMITCGRTLLTEAIDRVVEGIPPEGLRVLIYERKNELFPHAQPTSFFDDAAALNQRFPGRAFMFGNEDDHHLYLFHLDRPVEIDADDVTVEILMYGLDSEVAALFGPNSGGDPRRVRGEAALEEILPGFRVDDHLFEPGGYSLNAIHGNRYWTLHVSPNELSSYASFETNWDPGAGLEELTRRVVERFRPRSFDVVVFDAAERAPLRLDPYWRKTEVMEDLRCGYRVRFISFFMPDRRIVRPVELPIV